MDNKQTSRTAVSTKNGLPPETRKKVAELLNQLLATTVDLYSHAKQAHWNVRGHHFMTLHKLFDKVAEQVSEHGDEIAERAGQLGFGVSGTIRQAAKTTSLNDYSLQIASGEEHVERLSTSISEYTKLLLHGIEITDEADDPITTDLLTTICRACDQMLWFVESHNTLGTEQSNMLGSNKKQASAAVA